MAPEPEGQLDPDDRPLALAWVPGQQVGRYTLIAKVAVGGMAEIWIARQGGMKGFEKVVAIKKILDSISREEGFVQMFLDEARIAAQLNHPNIVQIYDLGEEAGAYYIAMEFLFGEALGRVVRQGLKARNPLPLAFAARIIANAADGLGYAHQKTGLDGQPLHIVHRDVSPLNLVLTYDGIVKLVDFGIAKAANRSSHTETGKFKGKVAYMSPEQALGEPIDGRADIFSLGVVLWELLARRRLFKFDDPVSTLRAIMDPKPVRSAREFNPEVPVALSAITLKALERNRERRYQSARELQGALEDWLRTQPDAAGTSELTVYMQTLFGERMQTQTQLIEAARTGDSSVARIPSSSDLSLPGLGGPGSGSGTISRVRVSSRRRVLLAAALGLGALAIGVAALWPGAEPAPVPPPGPTELGVETEPPGAMVTVDGQALGASPTHLEVATGAHTVVATLDGYQRLERSLTVDREGARTTFRLELKKVEPVAPVEPPPARVDAQPGTAVTAPKPVPRGRLSVRTTPWTEVFLGARKLGDTPLVDVSLPAGRYTLRLVNRESSVNAAVAVEVKPGETTIVQRKF